MTRPMRFEGLRKLSPEPAAKILAGVGAVLETPVEAPARALVPEVLAELEAKGATVDMLRLLAHALPPREAVWWACLSARDLLPADRAAPTPLAAAEAWVLRPGPETRARARAALEAAHHLDDTSLCAMAASMADGTLGPGELDDYPAPPGAVAGAAHALAVLSMFRDAERAAAQGAWLVARALDIARGGGGRAPDPSLDAGSEAGTDPAPEAAADAGPGAGPGAAVRSAPGTEAAS
ncbi:DUF6931 family protein [Albimonas pacifica]|uniref:Uncharacterized protein n=1 Tax=Albimonas pacifica TaxID=1114924 RepID=A0A1I3CZP7_9RHOB|nr:hypothetical protein [Albimonas pacifica]SFH79856.1 hypothetical protein SAMN05216258_102298 [Albimonas pacifica]